ncbi:MAG: iron ABC transporter permease [Treponema sp.]|nr:iron ABC transporter permease [Treponema sp.]
MNEGTIPAMKKSFTLLMVLLSLLLVPCFFLSLFSGSVQLSMNDILAALKGNTAEAGTASVILFEIRLPRIILAMAIGAALAIAGAAFQGIFANPLADPFVIGSSSGAALGAGAAISFGFARRLPFAGAGAVTLCAFAGSLLAVFLAFALSRSRGCSSAVTLLLAGTALSSFFSALLSLILVIRDRDLYQVYYWLLGSLNGSTWKNLPVQLAAMAAGSLCIVFCGPALDLVLQGEEEAESLGVAVRRIRFITALGASLAAGAAVASAGIIGFVGLIAPHIARIFSGPVHRRLLPLSAVTGALLLLLADMAARSFGSMELPLGIITSLLGAPFFLWLLCRYNKSGGIS